MKENILSKALKALNEGRIVVYPTDTLYAMGSDVFNELAVKNIFKIKKRPFNIPIPIAVSNIDDIENIAYLNDNARKLIDYFLPGGLTIILNKKKCIPDIVTSNLNKIAIRIPKNDVALELLSNSGPLTVTSANVHGLKTPENIEDIKMHLNDSNIAIYMDYGNLFGKPSTIVDVSSNSLKIIREGIISKKEISAVLYDK